MRSKLIVVVVVVAIVCIAIPQALALTEYEPKHTPTVGPCLQGQSYGQNGTGTQQGDEEYASRTYLSKNS